VGSLAMAKAMKASEQAAAAQPEAIDPSESPVVFDSSEVQRAEEPITWRWTRPAAVAALRVSHFQPEVAAGQPLYVPEQPSDQRVIAVAERGGQIIRSIICRGFCCCDDDRPGTEQNLHTML
jgi:hypothetical protein